MALAPTADNTMPISTITRTSRPVTVTGLNFFTWQQVSAQLGINNDWTNCLVVDLALGSWQGHAIIRQLRAQLSIAEPNLVQPMINVENQHSDYNHIIGRIIDNESVGDKNFMLAYNNACMIASIMQENNIRWLLLIPPQQGIDWEPENIVFTSLLTQALAHTQCKIKLLLGNNYGLPENWQLLIDHAESKPITTNRNCSVPGLVEHELLPLLSDIDESDYIELRSGLLAISPLCRTASKTANPDLHKALYQNDKFSYLWAYFETQATVLTADIEKLQIEAAKRFSEGGYGVALNLLAQLKNKIQTPEQHASVLINIQNIRIALMLFEDAANENITADVVAGLAPHMQASLLQSKAWGLVMIGRAVEAEPLFDQARELTADQAQTSAYLYLLNISALCQLRMGKADSALTIEKTIEKQNKASDIIDWHITYINSINLARLHKKQKQFSLAEKYYLEAFRVNKHLKNDSDLLYENICLGQLEEARGNNRSAFIFWLRASLYWLANPFPEALAPRVAQAILRQNLSAQAANVETISQILLSTLCHSAQQAGVSWDTACTTESLTFRTITASGLDPKIALGTAGLSLFATNEQAQQIYHGNHYAQLSTTVYSLSSVLMPELRYYQTVLIDTQGGCSMPANALELITACVRLQVEHLIYGNKKFRVPATEAKKLFLSSLISPCEAIAGVLKSGRKLCIRFKRFYPEIILNPEETELFQRLTTNITVAQLLDDLPWEFEDLQKIVRNMEEKKLLSLAVTSVQ